MTKRAYQLALTALLLSLNLGMNPAQAANATRTSSFVYGAGGLLVKEIIEPNDPQLCLVTEYQYDDFGNKKEVTTRNCAAGEGAGAPAAGSDAVIQPRTTRSTYDAKGQFAETTTNALGHTENRTFDPKFGAVESLIGPNGLTTSWTYDSFGRKKTETRADGTTTGWTYVPYNKSWTYTGHYWLGYYIATSDSGSTQPVYTYYDNLNRKLMTTRRNMADTDWIDEENTIYDAWGRISKVYLPYERANFANAKFTTYAPDILGRIKTQTDPDNTASDLDNPVTTKTYEGLTTRVTNALGQITTTLKNTQGQTVTVTDAQGKTINYAYDPFGNLIQTTDALGNVTKLKYDLRGRKIEMNDPDMGTWTYVYNALGELVRQVDAKGQIVTMKYDVLGRMFERSEPDLLSNWTYDTAAKGIGKLATATAANGYSRSHTYDGLGRLSGTSTTFDGNTYATSTSYDSIGRVDVQTYPASPANPTGFAVKNVYNGLGHLIQVVNAATPTTVYWTANAMDAMGHLTQQTYGNGITTQQIYNPATGRLENQLAGNGSAVQNVIYKYDSLGNLLSRNDQANNLLETFTYDTLNRVDSAAANSGAVNASSTFRYDAIGNITSKTTITTDVNGAQTLSDAGDYIYNASVVDANAPGGTRRLPHAVSGITQAAAPAGVTVNNSGIINGIVNPTFQYDLNGNMINPGFVYDANGNIASGVGRNVVWNSFNMPDRIDNCTGAGCKTAKFWYNGEHERVKEQQADGSIVITLSPRYDTGLHFEKKLIAANGQLTGEVEYEHYLYAGGLMFGKYVTVTQTDGVTLASAKTTYYSKDHLGSIVAITDEAGAVIERLSYDVWGKRRYPNGAADPNGLLNNPDMYHGYTGHEMLDEVGLIHMNGRLYDPLTARFVSPDTYIQAPGNLQSYNRYTYVWNNPLGATDPSGYLSFFGHKILPGLFNNNNARLAVSIGAAIVFGPSGSLALTGNAFANTLIAGGISGAISTGSIQGAVQGAFSAGLFYGAGSFADGMNWGEGSMGRAMAHAAVGCVGASASGGSCGSGALSAGFAAFAGPRLEDIGLVGNTVQRSILGGFASVLGGGKFASGAKNGAFGYLFNECAHGACTTALEQTLYDWWPGYKFGTGLYNQSFATGELLDGVLIVGGVQAKSVVAVGKLSANNIHHLFGRGGEAPAQLVERFGTVEAAAAELQVAAQGIATSAYETGAWVSVKVQNIPVSISGKVVDGVFRIGSIAKRAF